MRLKKFADFINEAKYEPDHELDRILDKISELGIDSITAKEKAYLDGERDSQDDYDGTYDSEDSDVIDSDGNYKKPDKSNYLLLVHGMDTDFHSSEIMVTAMDKTGKYVIDVHFVDMLFSELEEIGLEDVEEGHMGYYGKLTAGELVEKLRSMGFNSRIGNVDEVF